MTTWSRSTQLVVFAAIVAAVAALLTFAYAEAMPYLHGRFPWLKLIHYTRPYLLTGGLSALALSLSFCALSRISFLKHGGLNNLQTLAKISEIISYAQFASDNGTVYLNENAEIQVASQFVTGLTLTQDAAALIGQSIYTAFPSSLARLIADLLENSKVSGKMVAVEIDDWSLYPAARHAGPVLVLSAPAFRDGRCVGFAVVFRSSQELRLADNSLMFQQQSYQALFDNLPIGAAILRPSTASDGGPDGYVQEANAAFRNAFDVAKITPDEPASLLWPGFLAQTRLREQWTQVIEGSAPEKCEVFSPVLGKYFEITVARIASGLMLLLLQDQTEVRIHEQKVLELNDQLRRHLSQQRDYSAAVLDDITYFQQAVSDAGDAQLERLAEEQNVTSQASVEVTEACLALRHLFQQVGDYHAARHLPYRENVLVNTAEVVTALLEPYILRYPDIIFEQFGLPGVVANKEVLSCILELLLKTFVNLPLSGETARLMLHGQEGFLTTGITIAAYGFDSSPLFVEIPAKMEPLDWMLTSDLDLALSRRMVANHGGKLMLGQTPEHDGFQVTFTVGTPM